MVAAIVGFLLGIVFSFIGLLISLLPSFDWPDIAGYLTASGFSEYFAYLNWFFPVGLALSITLAWFAAILVYKLIVVFMDWIKAIIP